MPGGRQRKLAQVLCAIAEAVIGEDFSAIIGGGDTAADRQRGFEAFVRDVDGYQNKRTRGQVRTGLRTIESPLLRRLWILRQYQQALKGRKTS